MKDISEDCVPAEFLFGMNLSEKINSVKTLEDVRGGRTNTTLYEPECIWKGVKLPSPDPSSGGNRAREGTDLQKSTSSERRPSVGQASGSGQKKEVLKTVVYNFFVKQWSTVTSNPIVLGWVQGYRLPFHKRPIRGLSLPQSQKFVSSRENHFIQIEISNLLKIGAIKKCKPHPDQFISSIFLADKPNGKKRLIINLKRLNEFIITPHFKMEDARTASKLIRPGNFAATLDLKDAYYSLPILKDHRKYLRFWFRNTLYEFTCLPFGLASAPYTFSKLMRPVVEFLRSRDVLCVNYLDDFLILGSSKQECFRSVRLTTDLLNSLGFIINYQKSVTTPSRRSISLLITCKKCKILRFAQLLGLLTSACPAIKYGWVHTKMFERVKFLALMSHGGDYSAFMPISDTVKTDLIWWSQNIRLATNSLHRDHFDLEISTDASLSGWGAYCQGESVSGWWSVEDKTHHINILELKAIFFGLKCFAKDLNCRNILIRTDNTTALACINKMGSVQHEMLNTLTRDIWLCCENKKLWIFASYISSKENWKADLASRSLQSQTEWSLNQDLFNHISRSLGKPDIDLFASIANYKCERYISWFQDPGAESVDAFTVNWGQLNFYAFPPFSLVLRGGGILVVPFWKSQSWFPLFAQLALDDPLILAWKSIPCAKSFTLAVARLSGSFRRKGIPEAALDTMVGSLSDNTIKQYSTTFKRWWEFCQFRNISPFIGEVSDVIMFLQGILESTENNFGSFNAHRAALSLITSKNLGEDPQVKRFIKGIFRVRPPKPKYKSTWDPQQVLQFLENSSHDSLKFLSCKLVTLLALATGERLQTISLIKCSNITFSESGATIRIPDIVKTSRPNFHQPNLSLPYFTRNPRLCVASCLKHYLDTTKRLRQTDCDFLFLTFNKPHGVASKQTLSRWVKNTLKEAGVDTTIFKAHSTRHASTSSALRKGVSLDTIRNSAGWSVTSSTFSRYYNRPLAEPNSFLETVLSLD
ncbi:hypothetical protein NQ317_015437 [Molorchus minor]|uniref:Uncharacterized protein n=1 Tax=Molorchus minor TaxID=1323400 RepID=A0ABQ9J2X8_9CUCU|nr:hypothetical protein NQ317_015437 [Molorchus minor]